MRVNLQAQGVWDALEHGDVEECKDTMALAAIYQAVPKDVLLMLAEKDSTKATWETLQTMHVGVERVKEAKAQTLKSEFKAIRMKNGESIDDFSMKLTTIVSGIRPLGDMVEEIFVVKKFLRAVPPRFMQIFTSIEQFSDLKNMSIEEVDRLKVHEERLRVYEDKDEKNTSYSHMKSGSHERKRMMQLTLLFQVQGDVAAMTRKIEVVDVVANIVVDVVAEEAVTIPHKPMTMPTPRRTKV